MERNNPLVSVIVPTRNGQEHIKKSLESVMGQTYKNTEIVVIDDASTDGTWQILQLLAKRDSRIKLLRNVKNLGFVKSLNRSVKSAGGTYIARIDDDDEWSDAKKLEKQIGFLQKQPEYAVVGGGIIKTGFLGRESIRYLFPETDEDIRKTILSYNAFAHSAVVFRRSDFLETGGYDEKFGFFADKDLWLKLGEKGKFYNFPEYFIRYLDKEESSFYSNRNNLIRRKLLLNLKLRLKYKKQYKGFRRSCLLYLGSYVYSFIPYRKKVWSMLFKLRSLFFGPPPYQVFNKK